MRRLRCKSCRELVQVTEVLFGQQQPIDPDLYVCRTCKKPVAGQLELNDKPRTETRPYDFEIAAFPDGY